MRNINIILEDKEFNDLSFLKGVKSWRKFIIDLAEKEKKRSGKYKRNG